MLQNVYEGVGMSLYPVCSYFSDCRFVGRQEEDLKYVYVLRPPQVYLATLPLEW